MEEEFKKLCSDNGQLYHTERRASMNLTKQEHLWIQKIQKKSKHINLVSMIGMKINSKYLLL